MKMSGGHSYTAAFIWSVASLLLLASCGSKRTVVGEIGPASTSYVIEQIEKNKVDYGWFAAKVATELHIDDEVKSFKANVRMRKDSILWMSISPALGIEVARVIITIDSVKLVDKWNDTYYLGTHETIEDKMDLDLDLRTLQNLLVGNPPLFDVEENYKGADGDEGYSLISRTNGRLRKAVDYHFDERDEQVTRDSLALETFDLEHEDLVEKYEDNTGDLVIKHYWVNSDRSKVNKALITDMFNLRTMEVVYGMRNDVNGRKLPEVVEVQVRSQGKTSDFNMNLSRIKLNEATTFPFSIPDKFTEMEL